jgi:hypothetical protein
MGERHRFPQRAVAIVSDVDSAPKSRPSIVVWWEELSVLVQVAIVAPIAIGIASVLHIVLFVPNISDGRAISYGIFWGSMVTFMIVGATRAERARRLHAQETAAKAAERSAGQKPPSEQ